jgi:ATP-dependent helicase HepA
MPDFKIGQKWISNAEPELGMGRVTAAGERVVSLFFDMADEERAYARQQAPLTRVKFNPGDKIATRDDIAVTVKSVVEQNGIFIYHGTYQGTDTAIPETELDPNIRFSKPEDRLFTRQIDDNRWFNLRYHSLDHLSHLAESRSRGLYGPRVSLIPHQLYIAHEVATRFAPRVLLADEVGLGKTIEAGLIVHQQLQTGRSRRVLVIVPPALVFQWFVEMIRRFNLQFIVMDEERCQQIMADNMPEEDEAAETDTGETFNPFDAQQLMLCSIDLFMENPDRLEQALDADWDLVVVDEAHHLEWSPGKASIQYTVVELISRVSRGLLLLTATPEQLGRAGHFARLRLLDPDRFHDYETFIAEESGFEQVVDAVNRLLEGSDDARDAARREIREMLGSSDEETDEELIDALLDRHGTGRVLFRNVRSSVEGFPRRVPEPVALPAPEAYRATGSFYPETGTAGWVDVDPRVPWLIDLVTDRPADKFLVICAHRETAVALEKCVGERTAIRTTVFHEGMDLIARDRAAAFFAESSRGAQMLVCSEIGSEGRNFQFASNLVLFDLPPGPDLLEQRIGRLDRIGQQRDVHIHIPYIEDTPAAALYRWYEEGVNAFDEPNPAAQALFDEFGQQIGKVPIDELIAKTRQANLERREVLHRGRDRLLELNSHRPERSAEIVADIDAHEGGEALERYMELSFDMWGLESEPVGDGVFSVKPTESMVRHVSASLETLAHYHYPELPEDGIRMTYDRSTALAREDVAFFTWENPTVQQALDIAVTDVTGNSAMIAVRHPQIPSGTLLVEVLHVVDCVAPSHLSVDRYLPPRVLRSVVSPSLADIAPHLPYTDFAEYLLDVRTDALHALLESQMAAIRKMLDAARQSALAKLEELRDEAIRKASNAYDGEIERLTALREINATIRPDEIEYLAVTRTLSLDAIENADIRLDAIRVIVAG